MICARRDVEHVDSVQLPDERERADWGHVPKSQLSGRVPPCVHEPRAAHCMAPVHAPGGRAAVATPAQGASAPVENTSDMDVSAIE